MKIVCKDTDARWRLVVSTVLGIAICFNFGCKSWGAAEHPPTIHAAAMSGDVDGVKHHLDGGVDINLPHPVDGGTPLHYAVEHRKADIVRFLAENSANMEIFDNLDQTPLHRAASKGDAEFVRLLLECGADPENGNRIGFRPLHLAARSGDVEAARALVKAGADVHAKTEDQETPLHFACGRWSGTVYLADDILPDKNELMVEYLLDCGAEVNAVNNYGLSALHCCAANDYPVAAAVLIEQGGRLDIRSTKSMPILLTKARPVTITVSEIQKGAPGEGTRTTRHKRKIKGLTPADELKRNSSLLTGPAGMTPLCMAAICNRLRMADLFIDHGADAGDKKSPKTLAKPLELAEKAMHKEMVSLLKEAGASE